MNTKIVATQKHWLKRAVSSVPAPSFRYGKYEHPFFGSKHSETVFNTFIDAACGHRRKPTIYGGYSPAKEKFYFFAFQKDLPADLKRTLQKETTKKPSEQQLEHAVHADIPWIGLVCEKYFHIVIPYLSIEKKHPLLTHIPKDLILDMEEKLHTFFEPIENEKHMFAKINDPLVPRRYRRP